MRIPVMNFISELPESTFSLICFLLVQFSLTSGTLLNDTNLMSFHS